MNFQSEPEIYNSTKMPDVQFSENSYSVKEYN